MRGFLSPCSAVLRHTETYACIGDFNLVFEPRVMWWPLGR